MTEVYQFNSFIDIDECLSELDGCVENAECSDNEGSYICTCSSGFSGDGMSICDGELLSEPIHSSITYFPSDIDECLVNNECHPIYYSLMPT